MDAFAAETDADLPPWAGPAVFQERGRGTRLRAPAVPTAGDRGVADSGRSGHKPAGPAASRRPAIRRHGRAARARLRRSRRRVYLWCSTAIVLCIIGAGIAAIVTNNPAKPLPYVTQLLPGEFKSVPDSCTDVSPAVLDSYLPAAGRTMTQTISGSGESQCSFTVDRKPLFLVLEVTAQAYQPFAAASGNGSASQNALDNFMAARQALAHPAKKSPLPAATISALPNTGQQAFSAVQAGRVGGIPTEVVTVNVLERNVLITVSLLGDGSGHGFEPTSVGALQAGAVAAADGALAKVRTQPTA
jgi:hypothetical protein